MRTRIRLAYGSSSWMISAGIMCLPLLSAFNQWQWTFFADSMSDKTNIVFTGYIVIRALFNAQWRTKCAVINWKCVVTKGCLCSDKTIYQGMKMFKFKDLQNTMSFYGHCSFTYICNTHLIKLGGGVAETWGVCWFPLKIIFILAITCSKVINLQRKSDSKALHQILFLLVQCALPQAHLGKLTALLQHWRTHGQSGVHHFLKIWVSRFVEICIERDRISTKKRLKNASEPSIQAEIAPPPIPNSIFFWGKGGPPDSPPNSRVKVSGKSGFSCTPFQTPGYVTVHRPHSWI